MNHLIGQSPTIKTSHWPIAFNETPGLDVKGYVTPPGPAIEGMSLFLDVDIYLIIYFIIFPNTVVCPFWAKCKRKNKKIYIMLVFLLYVSLHELILSIVVS